MQQVPVHSKREIATVWPQWAKAARMTRAAGAIFTDPFRVDPEQIEAIPVSQREGRRRAMFLRLILSCTLFLFVVILLPAALLGQAAVASLWRLGLVGLLATVGVILNEQKRTTLASSIFIYGTLGITLHYLVTNPAGIDLQAILTLALFSVLILIAGLIMPGWATWLTAGIIALITLASLFLLPFAPPLQALSADPTQLRFAMAGPLVTLQLLIALFSWIAARSNRATVEAVTWALAREHELGLLKDQFITNINHELRTPLMALHGYVKLLRLRHQALSVERRGELIEKANRAGEDLVALVSSILERQSLSQAAGDFTAEAINVRESVGSAIRLVSQYPEHAQAGTLADRDLRIQIPEELAVWGEPVRLRQIFTNLLSNAMKYSAPGTPIEVTARLVSGEGDSKQGRRQYHQRQAPLVEITLRDYGHGIPPEQAHLLFERFVRLPRDLASNVAGNGLGLHLCRALTEAMGGRIWIESTGIESEGAAFHLRLPLPPQERTSRATSP